MVRISNVCFIAILATSFPAAADPAPRVTAAVERHFTSNALDGPFAVADWYTLIRGSLEQDFQIGETAIKLGAEAQAARFDEISIEDDRALALTAQASRKLSDTVELRGTLSYRIAQEGDDIQIGPYTIGTSTRTQTLGAQTELGVDLGSGTALVLSLADVVELTGDSKFQDDIFFPQKLDPDRNRLQIGARLVRTVGTLFYGMSATAAFVSVEALGFPPVGLSLAEYTMRAEAGTQGADGTQISAALGAQVLRGAGDIYCALRPTWQLVFEKPLPKGFELRGAFFGRFETADSDDPLASWLQRGEIETRWRASETFAIGSGLFTQIKQNLLFENEERSHGVYAEASYEASKAVSLVFRVDFSKKFTTVLDLDERTVDAFVGLRAKI